MRWGLRGGGDDKSGGNTTGAATPGFPNPPVPHILVQNGLQVTSRRKTKLGGKSENIIPLYLCTYDYIFKIFFSMSPR